VTRRVGAAHPNAKLSADDVAAIRASSLGPSALERVYKVSKATISLIKNNKLWVGGAPEVPPVQPAPPAAVVTTPVGGEPPPSPTGDGQRGAARASRAFPSSYDDEASEDVE